MAAQFRTHSGTTKYAHMAVGDGDRTEIGHTRSRLNTKKTNIIFCFFQFLKSALSHQFCESLLAHPRRKLIHEGKLNHIGK
jgi:hypothetical protein